MENENFVDWGPEDQERVKRFQFFDFRTSWLEGATVYHLYHQKSHIIKSTFDDNKELFKKLEAMSKEEKKEYYENVEYIKKYVR